MKFNSFPLIQSVNFEERYYLLEESKTISRSGSGTLFKAFDSQLQKDVFIKIYSSNSLETLEYKDRENRIKIRHKNLVSILDIFHLAPPNDSTYTEPLLVTVMDFVTREHLSTLAYPLSCLVVEAIECQLVAALNYFHSQGWVHQDVKPDNVLIQEIEGQWTVTLCDLEQAGRINSQPHALVGTPEYMSPAAAAWFPRQANFDFWSLGCLIYELLTGELPFGKRDFSLEPIEGIKLIQERIQKTDIQLVINRIPTPFQDRLTNYWAIIS